MHRGAIERLLRHMGEAIRDHSLISPGDQILLGVSGGKDSMLMAYLLRQMEKRSPVKYSLAAITLDPGEPFGFAAQDLATISDYLLDLQIPHRVLPTELSRMVLSCQTKDTACSLCTRLRRGAIYAQARNMGYPKVALAHHLDDAIETLLLNLFYQSRIDCFLPRTYLTRRDITVIRPMIYMPEGLIQEASSDLGLPVITTRCPIAGTSERQTMKDLVDSLGKDIPHLRNHMRGALRKLWAGGGSPGQEPAH